MSEKKSRWLAPVITFICGLVRDSQETIKQLTANMITHEKHVALIEGFSSEKDNNRKLYRELIKAATGFSDAEIKRLKAPDYNSLLEAVEEMFGKDSFHWFEKLGIELADDPCVLPLLVPLRTAGGVIDEIELQYPSMEAVDLMHENATDQQQMFILSSCTGLGPEELNQLSPPDWKSLDKRVHDFLYQTGSFFSPVKTSKS